MKKIILSLFFLAGISFCSQAQEGWASYMMPGPVHQQWANYVGAYRVSMSTWTTRGVTPETFDMQAVISMVMDNRFLQIEYHGEIMSMRYEAVSLLAYNKLSNKCTHVEYSTFGTGFMSYEGIWDELSKVAQLTGSTLSPEDKKIIGLRETIKFIGPDQVIFEVYDTREGMKEFKSLEIILDRIR